MVVLDRPSGKGNGMKWSEVFRRSEIDESIFVVAAQHEALIQDWVVRTGAPRADKVEMYMPARAGWAMPGGGVHGFQHYGFGGMRDGVRILGRRPLAAAIEDLGLVPPRRLSAKSAEGEPVLTLSPAQWAERIAEAYDAPTLRAVTREIVGAVELRP